MSEKAPYFLPPLRRHPQDCSRTHRPNGALPRLWDFDGDSES